jgi:hypothetical protein
MKFGKSLLLSELLKADAVDYNDVSENRFWIVCPSCSEAIFKVVRNAEAETPPLHYFSHYEASKAYASDCELRVGRITQHDVEQLAIQSRAQKLKYFITSLQKVIHEEFLNPFDGRTHIFTDSYFRVLSRSGTFCWYRNMQHQDFVKLIKKMSDEEILAWFDHNMGGMGKEEQQYLSTHLSIETQKRISLDLAKHLATDQARPSFDCLFNHAFTWFRIRLENNVTTNALSGIEEDLLPVLRKLPTTSRRKGILMLARLQQTDHSELYDVPCDALHTLEQALQGEMLRILIKLPYLQILRESMPHKTPAL